MTTKLTLEIPQVAIKCVTKKKMTHDDEAALKLEVAILQELSHPGVIKLLAYYEVSFFFEKHLTHCSSVSSNKTHAHLPIFAIGTQKPLPRFGTHVRR